MEIKIQCDCGQKFKFDAEPVDGRMPWEVNCPVCGAAGTDKANQIIAQAAPAASADEPPVATLLSSSAAAPVVAASAGEAPKPRLTIRHHAPAPAAPPVPSPAVLRPIGNPAAGQSLKKIKPVFGSPHWGKTILGAFIGSLIAVVIWVVLFKATGIKWGIMAMGVGWSTGFFARWIGRSEGQQMAMVTALIALVSIISFQAWRASTEMSMSDKEIDAEYNEELKDAKELVALMPNGTDEEIKAYLKTQSQQEGELLPDSELTKEFVDMIRKVQWQPAKDLVDGKKTKEDYRKEIRESEAELSDTTVFKIIFWIKAIGLFNIFFIIAGVAFAYKFGYGET
jgi:hypothetical protein